MAAGGSALLVGWVGHHWLGARAFGGSGLTDAEQLSTAASAANAASSSPRSDEPRTADDTTKEASSTAAAARESTLTRKIETPPLTGTTNLLLIGLDRRPGERGLGRPDTIVVAALSKETNHLGLISIPRDLYVDIPEHGPDRINSTYAVALRLHQKPADLLARVITDTLALPIHHTIVVDLGAFEQLVDALDGVDVDVPCPIVDDFVDPRTENGRRLLDVPEGLVHMDGITAGLYARSRHGRSDWNRARRQQAILFAIKRKAQSMSGLWRLPELLSTLEQWIQSDLSRAEALSLVTSLAGLAREDIHGLVFSPLEAVPTRLDSGKQVLVPEPEAITRALGQLFAAPAPGTPPEHAACFERRAALN